MGRRFRKYDVTRDSIRSRAVLASILPLIDSHGQSLALPFDETSPFSRSGAGHGTRNLRECPMQKCRHRFQTPWDLIKHLLVCEEAPRGSVECEQCALSHGMTRLMSPTQLYRKVMRKRSSSHTSNLVSYHQGQGHILEVNEAKSLEPIINACTLPKELNSFTQPTELDSPRLFEMKASGDLELDSEQVFEMNSAGNYEYIPELPPSCTQSFEQAQVVKSGSDEKSEPADTNSVVELDAPQSIYVPSPVTSSTASRQTTSRKWSGVSQATTLLNKSPRGCSQRDYWHYTETSGPKLCQSTSDVSYPLAAASSPELKFTALRGPWLPHVALTLSPEEMGPTRGTHAPWPSMRPPYIQQSMSQTGHSDVMAKIPQPETEKVFHDEGLHKFPSWPSSAAMDRRHWPTSSDISDTFVSYTPNSGVYDQFQLANQSFGGLHVPAYELDNATTGSAAHSSISTVVPTHLTTCSPGSWRPRFRDLKRKNASRASGARLSRQKSQIEVVADANNDILRCTFPNCKYRPTGDSKNFRSRLKRHESTHLPRTRKCSIPSCSRTFPIDRKDNLIAHVRNVHGKLGRPKGQRVVRTPGTAISEALNSEGHESESLLDKPRVRDDVFGALDDQMNDSGLHGNGEDSFGHLLHGILEDKSCEMMDTCMEYLPGGPALEWPLDNVKNAGGAHYLELERQMAACTSQIYQEA